MSVDHWCSTDTKLKAVGEAAFYSLSVTISWALFFNWAAMKILKNQVDK